MFRLDVSEIAKELADLYEQLVKWLVSNFRLKYRKGFGYWVTGS